MIRTAIITMSDTGARGERVDESGTVIREMMHDIGATVSDYRVLPDEKEALVEALTALSDSGTIELILTSGGTGVSPRDITPEATLQVLDREIPGMAEAMRSAGSRKTPHAMISRAVAGIRKETLIINLPGSSKGAVESMQALFPGILHIFPMMEGKGHEAPKPNHGG